MFNHLSILNIPDQWPQPKYSFGQRTKQGLIAGLIIYPPNSELGRKYGSSWRYTILPKDPEEEVEYLLEEDVQPLSPEEFAAEIEQEINHHKEALKKLNSELDMLKSDFQQSNYVQHHNKADISSP